MQSTNPRDVGLIFREYARKIHLKAAVADPYFEKICISCAKVHTDFPYYQYSL